MNKVFRQTVLNVYFFGHSTFPEATNDRMFPIVCRCLKWFSLRFREPLEACLVIKKRPKKYLSCRMSWYGKLVVSNALYGIFVASETVSYPNGSSRKFDGMEWPYFH